VLDQTGSPILAGLVGTLRMVAYLVVHLPAGALADRLRRRRVLLASDAVWAILMGAIGIALLLGRPLPTVMLLAFAVAGTLIGSVADPAGQAATRHLVTEQEMPSALALNTLRAQTLGLVAPLAGGVLYEVWPALPFLIDAGTYVVSMILVYLIRTPLGGGENTDRTTLLADIGTGMRFLWRSEFLRSYLGWAALANFATGGLTFALILVVQERGGSQLGVALAAISVGGLAGAALAPRLKVNVPLVCAARVLIAAVMVASPQAVTLSAGMVLTALLGATMSIPLNARVYELVPDELTGRVQSAMTLVGGSLYPFAGVVTGFLAERWSVRSALGLLTAVLVVVMVLSVRLQPRRLDREDPEQARQEEPVSVRL
jgi:MFS family permease